MFQQLMKYVSRFNRRDCYFYTASWFAGNRTVHLLQNRDSNLSPSTFSTCNLRFYSAASFDYSLKTKKLAQSKEDYVELCQKIVSSQSSEISHRELVSVPAATSEFCEFDYFVKEISAAWWRHMEIKLMKLSPKNLASIFNHLQNIDYYTNGRLINAIQWTAIEKIACEFFRNIENVDFSNLETFLKKLSTLADSEPTFKISPLLQKLISVSTTAIFSGKIYAEKSTVVNEIGPILFALAKLEIQLPESVLPNVYVFCVELFKNSETSVEVLTAISQTGFALYTLNLNPGHYFWKQFFKSLKFHLLLAEKNAIDLKPRFIVTMLKTAFLVGVGFCESQYKIFQHVWIDFMHRHLNSMTKHEIDLLLNLADEKFSSDLTEIENVFSAEILHRLLQYTDSFKLDLDENRLKRTGAALATDNKSLKLGKTKYLAYCQQISDSTPERPCQIPAADLVCLPQTALECKDIRNFVKLFPNWCREMLRNRKNVPGYQLVHVFPPLVRINTIRKGEIQAQLSDFPDFVENLADPILESVCEPMFTHSTMSMLVSGLTSLHVDLGREISESLKQKLNNGFNTFFEPKYFSQRNFNANLCETVGQIIYKSNKLDLEKPSSEDSLKIIAESCAKKFRLQAISTDNYRTKVFDCFLELSPAIYTFYVWNFDADTVYANFWRQFFESCRINLPQLSFYNAGERKVKNNILTNSMLAILRFNKEEDFETSGYKNVWQKDVSASLVYKLHFSVDKVESILKEAESQNKYASLESLLSKNILTKFEKLRSRKN